MKISVCILLILIAYSIIFSNINILYLKWEKHQLVQRKANLFYALTVITLIVISALRGDFSTDYPTYIYQIKIYAEQSVWQVLQARDFGYAIIMRTLYLINNGGFVCIFVLSVTTILAFSLVIRRESKYGFLSFVIFVALDSYVISFNLMRNILAVSLVFCSVRLIWEKKPLKFIISIVLISFIHRSALVMIPMYWVLQKDFRKRKNSIWLLIGVIGVFVAFTYARQFLILGQDFIGMNYTSYDNYGLDFGNVGSALKTTLMMGFVFLNNKKIDYTKNKNLVYVNMCIFAWVFQLLAARVLMFQRIGYYFSTAFIILIPNLIVNSKHKKFITSTFLAAILVYVNLFQNVNDFYWVWENKKILFW